MRRSRSSTFWGYIAGIVTGATYGMNPLFAKPMLENGVSVDTMLFFRYFLAVIIMGVWLIIRRENLKIEWRHIPSIIIMGITLGASGLFLFEAYKYMPSGPATTIIYLYPVVVAIIMIFLKVYPKWQVWLSIILTFLGVAILCKPEGEIQFDWRGIILSFCSAVSYAIFIVFNRNKQAKELTSNALTFYVMLASSGLFMIHHLCIGDNFLKGTDNLSTWSELIGLAIFPTIISMVTLAVSIRLIGATKTSVLGVFEPLVAILIGTVIFNEPFTWNIAIGIVICISAIIFMALTTSRLDIGQD